MFREGRQIGKCEKKTMADCVFSTYKALEKYNRKKSRIGTLPNLEKYCFTVVKQSLCCYTLKQYFLAFGLTHIKAFYSETCLNSILFFGTPCIHTESFKLMALTCLNNKNVSYLSMIITWVSDWLQPYLGLKSLSKFIYLFY